MCNILGLDCLAAFLIHSGSEGMYCASDVAICVK